MALMKNLTRGLLIASALSGWGASPAFAILMFSGEPFQVQEGAIPGANPNLFTAYGISFSYQATINQAANGAFTETGFVTKTAFTDANAAALPSQLNGSGLNGYGIYGTFSITGISAANGAGGVTSTYTSFNLNLFSDPNQDSGPFSTTTGPTGITSEDQKLLSMTLNPTVGGGAHVFAGLANGDFNALLNMSVTPEGAAFFVSPNPFYQLESISGNTATITGLALPGTPFTAQASGAGIETFQAATPVPEPASLALLVSGLGGLGALCWRRKRKQAA